MGENWLTVAPGAVGFAVLRRTVHALCAGTSLPLDRVDDVAIVCEELLGRAGVQLAFRFRVTPSRVEVAVPLPAPGLTAGPIVSALATELAATEGDGAMLQVALAA